MNRREALELLIALPILAGCGSGYRSFAVKEDGDLLIVDIVNFPQTGIATVRSKRFTYPIIVFRESSGAFSAFLAECTHKGCELQPEGSVLVCPCHGSEFASNGRVLTGPATKNLLQFRTTAFKDSLHIHLS